MLVWLLIKFRRNGNKSGHNSGQSCIAMDATAIPIAVQIFLWGSSNANRSILRMLSWWWNELQLATEKCFFVDNSIKWPYTEKRNYRLTWNKNKLISNVFTYDISFSAPEIQVHKIKYYLQCHIWDPWGQLWTIEIKIKALKPWYCPPSLSSEKRCPADLKLNGGKISLLVNINFHNRCFYNSFFRAYF